MTHKEALEVLDEMVDKHGCCGFECSDCAPCENPKRCPVIEARETLSEPLQRQSETKETGQ